jgi:hypothetical protein
MLARARAYTAERAAERKAARDTAILLIGVASSRLARASAEPISSMESGCLRHSAALKLVQDPAVELNRAAHLSRSATRRFSPR